MTEQTEQQYRIHSRNALDGEPNSIEVAEPDGSARIRVNDWEELARWMIEHGEHAAAFELGAGHEILLVLPEPVEGLFEGLNIEPLPIAWTFEYAGGWALALLAEFDAGPKDDPAQGGENAEDAGSEGKSA